MLRDLAMDAQDVSQRFRVAAAETTFCCDAEAGKIATGSACSP
jgi:hypothetical protein